MSRLRYHIATSLYKLFPSRFCWAELACWQMGGEPFWKLIRHWRRPTGCIIDSKVSTGKDCYCGSWYKGHHCASAEGRKLLEEMRAEQAADPLTDELPF